MTIENDKKLKIASYGITVASQDIDGDLYLIGLTAETLRAANSYFRSLPENFDLANVIETGNLFFYKIELFDSEPYPKRSLIQCENGIGELVKKNNRVILKRHYIKKCFSEKNGWSTRQTPLNFPVGANLLLTTNVPTEIGDLFLIKHTVLCSLGDGLPEIVPLNNNELLANINGDIKSIPLNELLNNINTPVIIKSNRLELDSKDSTVRCNIVNLKSQRSRPQNAEAGTIIFNNRKKVFEGFDGEQWRTLKWE